MLITPLTLATWRPIYEEMSEDRTPYKPVKKVEELSDLERIRRAMEVYKRWIWRDKIEIGALRTRISQLELDFHDLKEFMNRILAKSDN